MGFQIENGVLKKYTEEPGVTEVVIPDGVTCIGQWAFSYCSSLTSITLPDSVTGIGERAFGGCSSLTSITLPEGVTSIGERAFFDCSSLTSITLPESVTSIGEFAFFECSSLTSITLPEGVTSIGEGAFYKCSSLTSIAIPESVTIIDNWAFAGCDSLKKIRISALSSIKTPQDILEIIEPLFPTDWLKSLSALPSWSIPFIVDITPEDIACILLYQSNKKWQEFTWKASSGQKESVLLALASIIDGCTEPLTNAVFKRIYSFGQENHYNVSEISLQKLAAALKKNNPKLAKKADWSAFETVQEQNEVETYAETHNLHPELTARASTVAASNIPYSDGTGNAPKKVIAVLLAEYMAIWEQAHKQVAGDMSYYDLASPEKVVKSEIAQKIADYLDRDALSAYLLQLAGKSDYRNWIYAFAVFATDADIQKLTANLKRKPAKERIRMENTVLALCLSDQRAAMQYAEKNGYLREYAQLRGYDEDTFRDVFLMNLGLDENGNFSFDLGGKTITARLTDALDISLWDDAAGKEVKSVPKKGTDPEKYADVSKAVSELKKNIKKLVKMRTNRLFASMLEGESFRAEVWQKSYLTNPLLRAIGSLLVWEQKNAFFTVRDRSVQRWDGTAIALTGDPIRLAYPAEMDPMEVSAWQNYFASNGIRQPFVQIWEPVHNENEIDTQRYADCMIPYYRFLHQEKHGIYVIDEDFHNEITIDLSHCISSIERIDCRRHDINVNDRFEVTFFKFSKYTRQVNHIVAYLDKVTVYERVKKDDVSIVQMLDSFTLAQITEFIRIAGESNAANVTAILLEYKNAKYPDADPFAEFVLDL